MTDQKTYVKTYAVFNPSEPSEVTITVAADTSQAGAPANPEAEPGQGPVETKEPGDGASLVVPELVAPDSKPPAAAAASTSMSDAAKKYRRKYALASNPAAKAAETAAAAAVGKPKEKELVVQAAVAVAAAQKGADVVLTTADFELP